MIHMLHVMESPILKKSKVQIAGKKDNNCCKLRTSKAEPLRRVARSPPSSLFSEAICLRVRAARAFSMRIESESNNSLSGK